MVFQVIGKNQFDRVDFGASTGMPSCTCKDWRTYHIPCKHFFGVFQKREVWSWEKLPALYLESEFLCLEYTIKKYISDDISTTNSPLDEDIIICDPLTYTTLPSKENANFTIALCFHDRMHIHACMLFYIVFYQIISQRNHFFRHTKEIRYYQECHLYLLFKPFKPPITFELYPCASDFWLKRCFTMTYKYREKQG